MPAHPTDPAVAGFLTAVGTGDKDAFFAALTDDSIMSDDGTERALAAWADNETFSANGPQGAEDTSADARPLTATCTDSTWGSMRTR